MLLFFFNFFILYMHSILNVNSSEYTVPELIMRNIRLELKNDKS